MHGGTILNALALIMAGGTPGTIAMVVLTPETIAMAVLSPEAIAIFTGLIMELAGLVSDRDTHLQ